MIATRKKEAGFMKLWELQALQRQEEARQEQAWEEGRQRTIQWLEKCGICIADGWGIQPVAGEPSVLLSHPDLKASLKVRESRAGNHFASIIHDPELPSPPDDEKSVCCALDLLYLLEHPQE